MMSAGFKGVRFPETRWQVRVRARQDGAHVSVQAYATGGQFHTRSEGCVPWGPEFKRRLKVGLQKARAVRDKANVEVDAFLAHRQETKLALRDEADVEFDDG